MKRILKMLTAAAITIPVGFSLLGISSNKVNATPMYSALGKDANSGAVVYSELDTVMCGQVGIYKGYSGDSVDVTIPSEISNPFNSEKYTNSTDENTKMMFTNSNIQSWSEKTSIKEISEFYVWKDDVDYTSFFINYGESHDLEKTAALKSITIAEGIEKINNEAFVNCTSLENIIFPSTLKSVAGNAFNGTAWLEKQPDGIIYINNIVVVYKGDMPENSKIEIEDGTTVISECAFQECSNLTEIVIPYTVTTIEDKAFDSCTGLTEITIPDSVTEIKGNPFSYCKSDKLVIMASAGTAAEEFAKSKNITFKVLSDSEESEITESLVEENSESNTSVSSASEDTVPEVSKSSDENNSSPVVPIVIGIVAAVIIVAVVLIARKSKKE